MFLNRKSKRRKRESEKKHKDVEQEGMDNREIKEWRNVKERSRDRKKRKKKVKRNRER